MFDFRRIIIFAILIPMKRRLIYLFLNRWTPFKGPICADEIGVNMRTNYMIKYDFKGNYKSTIAEKIHVGFTTTDPKGFLIGAYSVIR